MVMRSPFFKAHWVGAAIVKICWRSDGNGHVTDTIRRGELTVFDLSESGNETRGGVLDTRHCQGAGNCAHALCGKDTNTGRTLAS